MNKEELLSRGYTRYNPPLHKECVTDFFQKCIKDDVGKRYYIDIELWDFSRFARNLMPRYQASVQLTHKQTGPVVDIVCHDGWSIDALEQYYDDLWSSGKYEYYERY